MISAARLKDVFREAPRNGDQATSQLLLPVSSMAPKQQIQTWGEASPLPEHPGHSTDSPKLCLCVRIGKYCCLFWKPLPLNTSTLCSPFAPQLTQTCLRDDFPTIYIFMLCPLLVSFCLQPVTFGQVWDPPGLSTVAGRQIPPAVQNTVGRGMVRVFSLRPMLLLHWEVAEISPIKPEFTTMKSCFVFYKSRGSIEALHSPKSFRKATERTTGGFGSTAKNKPHPNTPTDCGWHWTGPICEM